MAVVYAEKILEIAVIQTVSGRPAVNVWHMYHDQELTGPDKEGVVQDFANNWQDHILEIQCANVALQRFEWRSLSPGDGTVGTLAPDPGKNVVGQNAGAPAPPNVALLIKKNTAARPRGRRDGRCFLAGIFEGNIDADGAIAPAGLSAWQGFVNSFYNGISDSGTVIGGWDGDSYPVVLETTPESRAPGTDPVTVDSRRVTSLTIDPVCSTQRDRLR